MCESKGGQGVEGGEVTCLECLMFVYSGCGPRAYNREHLSKLVIHLVVKCPTVFLGWISFTFYYRLMQFFFKDIYSVNLFFPSVPSKPSVFTSLLVTCVLFIIFLSLYFLSIGFG